MELEYEENRWSTTLYRVFGKFPEEYFAIVTIYQPKGIIEIEIGDCKIEL
ncbi:hypothetical protein HCR_01340 [Hydrogenimonas cancrithermarum]|uniref:Uncharacterized protein n=1 Tax=Hydrogenimonas cancrithermarum TaxID=2993563 RepID=A0ABN6WU34_9BACT|nr:hypothetical protein HCR_01340 [Hydrogenimonas cancrithermarum]